MPILAAPSAARAAGGDQVRRTDAEWRKDLSPEAYEVLRRDKTEAAGSSPLAREKRAGTYRCAGCALPVFSSKTKYDAGTGYPSFTAPLPKAVAAAPAVHGKAYGSVHCARCDSHLGRLYHDGPKPAGLHYSMNGIALAFLPNSA